MTQYTFRYYKHPHYGYDTYYVVVADSREAALAQLSQYLEQQGSFPDQESIAKMYESEAPFTGIIEYQKPWEE